MAILYTTPQMASMSALFQPTHDTTPKNIYTEAVEARLTRVLAYQGLTKVNEGQVKGFSTDDWFAFGAEYDNR